MTMIFATNILCRTVIMTVADPSVKEVLTAMAESSSIHGVSRWVTSKHWYQRALWLLVFLGATGGAFYQLSRLYVSYTSYPVKTSMELEFSSLMFPAVSFCNMNPIRTSKLSLTTNATQVSLKVSIFILLAELFPLTAIVPSAVFMCTLHVEPKDKNTSIN